MPRPKNLNPPVATEIHLPQALDARLRLTLYSEVEGRIPRGAISDFMTTLLQAYFDKRDAVSGQQARIDALTAALRAAREQVSSQEMRDYLTLVIGD